MKYFILVCFFTLVNLASASAQNWAFELWHEGKLVLETGDTLKGQIKYDLQQDLIQFKSTQSTPEAYTARKVVFFEIFDNTVRRYRQFFSLPYSINVGYKAPVFFELLVEGNITLLSREALEYRTFSSPYIIGGSYTRLVLVNNYYLLEENGDIEAFEVKRSDLLNKMGRKANTVEQYMKDNRLRVDDKYELVRIINYYNTL